MTVQVIEQARAVRRGTDSRLAWGPYKSRTQEGRRWWLVWFCCGLAFCVFGFAVSLR
jgi:hypothetical protein